MLFRSNGYLERQQLIWFSDLSTNETVVALALNYIQEEEVWGSALKISKMCSLSARTVTSICRNLEGRQMLATRGGDQTPEQIKKHILFGKQPQVFCGVVRETCEWCNCTTAVLHSHHYPVRKEHGGTETVDICPNCHFEYHAIEGLVQYSLNPQHSWFVDVAPEVFS